MDLLIDKADYILTLDNERRIIKDGSIVIEDGTISCIGKTDDIRKKYSKKQFEQVIEGHHRLVSPGFVNCHVHAHEHLARGLGPNDLRTGNHLLEWLYPYYGSLDADDEYIAAKIACLDMIKSGTTCFIDVGVTNVDSLGKAVTETGIRAIIGRRIMDKPPENIPEKWRPGLKESLYFGSVRSALKETDENILRWNGAEKDRIRAWVILNGKQTCSDELYVKGSELSQKRKVGFYFHMASSIEEAKLFERDTGDWPITHLDKLGVLRPEVLMAHVVALKDEEVKLLKNRGSKVCFCPGTAVKEAKGATAIGKFPELLSAGVTVSLGCDGASAAGSFDMVRQIYLVSTIFRDARMDPRIVPPEQGLEMGTINGARSLLWNDQIGSLEAGKKADMILFDTSRLDWLPMIDPVRNLVYSADGHSIDTTIIDGKVVVENGRAKFVNEKELTDQAQQRMTTILKKGGVKAVHAWPIV